MTTETPTDSSPHAEDAHSAQEAGGRALRGLLRPVSASLMAGRVLAVISSVLAVAPYVALVKLGEVLLAAQAAGTPVDGDRVRLWTGILVGAFTARLLTYFLALTITHFADIRLGDRIRRDMVAAFSRTPLTWFTSTNSGRVRKALQDDITTVHQLIAHQPVDGTVAMVMPVALTVYAFIVDWRLGLLSVAVVPLYALVTALTLRGMGEKTAEMDQRLGEVSSRMVEFVTGISVVKAFGRVGRAHGRYQQAADDFFEFYYAWCQPLIRVSAAGQSVLAVPVILLVNLGGGAWLVHQGYVSAADVLATSLIALLVPYALETLMNSTWSRQMAGAAALRLVDLLHLPALASTNQPRTPDSHDVTFDRVSYSYTGEGGSLAVDNVSFILPANTVTALVGPSGSGKSTIATLLARFDDPQSGTISIGGVPLPQISDLYTHVSFVLQDPQLPAVSIRDNIALGRPDATDEQLRAAADAANILTDIEQLPDGFDTVYGSGSGLSGGQAQRIAIARALLVDAPVLVLDEATALTDPESQHEIQQALSTLARGRTVLVIAHRREAVAGVHQIIHIAEGKVVQ